MGLTTTHDSRRLRLRVARWLRRALQLIHVYCVCLLFTLPGASIIRNRRRSLPHMVSFPHKGILSLVLLLLLLVLYAALIV